MVDYIDGQAVSDEFTRELDDEVQSALRNEKWRLEYMTLQQEYREKITRDWKLELNRDWNGESRSCIMIHDNSGDSIQNVYDRATRRKDYRVFGRDNEEVKNPCRLLPAQVSSFSDNIIHFIFHCHHLFQRNALKYRDLHFKLDPDNGINE